MEYLKKVRASEYLKKVNLLHLTIYQATLIVVLAGSLYLFFSFWMMRIEQTPNPRVLLIYWGFPFEAIKVINRRTVPPSVTIDEYHWSGIMMNVAIYMAFSIIIVKLATWIRDEVEYRRRARFHHG